MLSSPVQNNIIVSRVDKNSDLQSERKVDNNPEEVIEYQQHQSRSIGLLPVTQKSIGNNLGIIAETQDSSLAVSLHASHDRQYESRLSRQNGNSSSTKKNFHISNHKPLNNMHEEISIEVFSSEDNDNHSHGNLEHTC